MSPAAARRPFSAYASVRAAVRAFEAHPFQRLPLSQKTARPDWGREFKRVGSQAIVYDSPSICGSLFLLPHIQERTKLTGSCV